MVPVWKEKEKIDSKIISKLEAIENKTYKNIEKFFNLN